MNKCNFCSSVREWINRPFKEDGNITDWFLFIGLLGFISWLWSRILARILS